MNVRLDVAFIQPLRYSLRTWMRLRTRLASLQEEPTALERLHLAPATVHDEGIEEPLFDRTLESTVGLPDAFRSLLREARDYPCVVVPLEDTAEHLLADPDHWPEGLTLETAASHLVLPTSGDAIVLHLASGGWERSALADPDRLLQRELRLLFNEGATTSVHHLRGTVAPIVGSLLDAPVGEGADDDVTVSTGHLVTIAGDASPDVVEALTRVHVVQEGTASNDGNERFFAHFGWSYSTLATSDRAVSYRFLFPLMAVNQAWYRYRELRGDVIDMSRAIDRLETDRALVDQSNFFNQVVLHVKVWEAERERFARGLRPLFRTAYDHLWEYWDTGESRATVHDGLDSSRDFLDRKFMMKITQRENTQSKILFVIALFQLLSIFGLVSGYLYFWEKTRLPENAIFDSEFAVWLTLLSPFVVLVAITWLLVAFMRRSR